MNTKNVLRYFHVIYISKETFLKIKSLRRCHDDSLTNHFEKKIINLIQKKFY